MSDATRSIRICQQAGFIRRERSHELGGLVRMRLSYNVAVSEFSEAGRGVLDVRDPSSPIRVIPRWRLVPCVLGVALLFVSGWPAKGWIGHSAAALIVIAALPLPWGAEAYRRRCGRSVMRASREIESVRADACAERRAHLKVLKAVTAPERLID